VLLDPPARRELMRLAGARAFGIRRERERVFGFGVSSAIASPVRFAAARVPSLAGIGPGERRPRPIFGRPRPATFGAGLRSASGLVAIARPLRLSFVVLSSGMARGIALPLSKTHHVQAGRHTMSARVAGALTARAARALLRPRACSRRSSPRLRRLT
jgi:hypothetical protein